MSVTPRLEFRQAQTLVMTPQLQQAIKLLQFSNLELNEYIDDQIEQNPLLEQQESQTAPAEGALETPASATDSITDSTAQDISEPDLSAHMQDSLEGHLPQQDQSPLDADFSNVWDSDSAPTPKESATTEPAGTTMSMGNSQSSSAFQDDSRTLEDTLSHDLSLKEHLNAQIDLDISEPDQKMIAYYLVDSLDAHGYLRVDLTEIAENLNCPQNLVDQILHKLQKMDPPGIFARSLQECLALQLADQNRLDPMIQTFLDHIHLLEQGKIKQLQKICDVSEEDFMDMLTEIRALTPFPAQDFDHETIQTVVPDVIMREGNQQNWIIELNSESLPRLLVNNHYHAIVQKNAKQKAEKEYISECYNTANWLVKALEQRADTIIKVASEIVIQQDAFFQYGIQYMKPLVLRDIAEAIDMHESTVSRVTSNKYIETPRGLFELKYFFTSSISGANGSISHSAESVRHRIKSLIDAETHKTILSDDKLVALLKSEGIDIARRTVAKYRESMKIASSVQRRRQKTMAAKL